jgi:hypothetical protein
VASHCQASSVKFTDRIFRGVSDLGANLPDMFRALLLITVSING